MRVDAVNIKDLAEKCLRCFEDQGDTPYLAGVINTTNKRTSTEKIITFDFYEISNEGRKLSESFSIDTNDKHLLPLFLQDYEQALKEMPAWDSTYTAEEFPMILRKLFENGYNVSDNSQGIGWMYFHTLPDSFV